MKFASWSTNRGGHFPARRVPHKGPSSQSIPGNTNWLVNAAEMELSYINSAQDDQEFRASASPFSMSSRPPTASPHSWELHDVDFLLSGPVASTSHSCFQDVAFSAESDETTKPLTFRSGTYWQDMATNELSTYLADDIFSDKVVSVSRSPSSKSSRDKIVPPIKLRVNASACTDENLRSRNNVNTLKNEASVVSPTMVDKKVLVTDNDLRLFSTSNMKTLRGRKAAKSTPRVELHPKKTKNVAATPTIHRQRNKRRASLERDLDDQTARALKRTESLDQQPWTASSFDPQWYWGRMEGFHGMQPRLLSPINLSTSLDYSGVNTYRRVQQHSQYSPPTRKIGIYSPAERRERLKRFHEKRKLRVYHKRIKYDCRKRLANSCPRVKGRFVRKSEYLQTKESDATSPSTSESTSSTEK